MVVPFFNSFTSKILFGWEHFIILSHSSSKKQRRFLNYKANINFVVLLRLFLISLEWPFIGIVAISMTISIHKRSVRHKSNVILFIGKNAQQHSQQHLFLRHLYINAEFQASLKYYKRRAITTSD